MSSSDLKVVGVVGDPISHSLSPRLHSYWLKKYNIPGEYVPFHITKNELPGFITSIKGNNIMGLNLTVPHKESVITLIDEVDASAKKIGAINTIYFDDKNRTIGSNTDGHGFLKHLKSSSLAWRADNSSTAIIGAGGAARAAIVSLLDAGVPEIRLINRTQERAVNLAGTIDDIRIKVTSWDHREEALVGIKLLVNVTTLGMVGQPPLELSLDKLPKDATVYDIVYNPIETELIKQARARGNKTVDGLGMLLHQAAAAFKIWFGVDPEVDEGLRNHVLKAL